jgi:putative ABC transport system permease protein
MPDRSIVDLVAALRSLRAAPAVPAAIILTTALAVGINLAMAGLIDRALLSPPPHVVDPDRVFTVAFEITDPAGEKGLGSTTSFLSFEAIRTAVPGVTPAAWTSAGTSVVVENERLVVKATAVTSEYFAMLGARAQRGRTLLTEDDRPPAGASVAVLSHSLWRRAFAGDAHVLGRRVRLGALELDVIGVMPPGFSGHSAERTDLWVPLPTAMRDHPGWDSTPNLAFAEIGVRLAAGQTASRAAAQLGAATGTKVVLAPIIGAHVAPDEHRIAWWLAAVSLVVLLAGLANSATLALVRRARRQRETSIRMSLGASRGRLACQLLTEATIVASAATLAALIMGYWLDEMVRRLLFPFLIESVGITRRVIVAAGAGGACTLLVVGTAGILHLPTHVNPADLLGARRTWRRAAVQHHLLIIQTTLAVLLITAAGMLGQRYVSTADGHQYARLDDVVVVEFERGPRSLTESQQDDLLMSAVDRARALPGVAAATPFFALPFHNVAVPPIDVPGRGEPRVDGELPFLIDSAPELFDILRIEIVRGRRFTASDDRGAPPVVIVSETMARAVWPGVSALGKCIRIGHDPKWDPRTARRPPTPSASAPCREIVGIARDWQPPADRPAPAGRIAHYYVPFAQGLLAPPGTTLPRVLGLLLRLEPGVAVSADAIRRAVRAGRDTAPFLEVRPYIALHGPRLAQWLMGTKLLLLFGALALATAAVGIHAAFAHAVAQRRHEIAVRVAVGASRRDVVVLVLREGALVATHGIATGVIVAMLAGWVARSMIVGLASPGPLVIALTASSVLVVAILATWGPALAASRAEPSLLLRGE